MSDALFSGMSVRQQIVYNLACKAYARLVDRGYSSGDNELFLAMLQHATVHSGRKAAAALCIPDLERYERHLISLGPSGRTRSQDDDLRLIGKVYEYAETGQWPSVDGLG